MSPDYQNPVFTDADKAREWLEARLWPDGPVCPHCGVLDGSTAIQGKSHRAGLYMCNECRKQFTVTVGTVYERSHIPLNKWLYATYLMSASKKGISAHQLHRTLGITYKSAWFMAHRIREGLRPLRGETFGGPGKAIEMDETYVGGKDKNKHVAKRMGKLAPKEPVFALVERKGRVRSHHVADVSSKTLHPIIAEQVKASSRLMTDEANVYTGLGWNFAEHGTVKHSIYEYVRGDIHTNTIEGYFSILKRGIIGTYHHVSAAHLKRYLAEFDFRYNERSALGVNDAQRAEKAIDGIVGRRLTYRRTGEANA